MKAKIAAVALSILSLAACNAPAVPVGPIENSVNSVLADAKQICGIVANYADVAALVGAMVPGVDTAESIASMICTGIGSLSSTRFRAGAGIRIAKVYLHGNAYIVHAH